MSYETLDLAASIRKMQAESGLGIGSLNEVAQKLLKIKEDFLRYVDPEVQRAMLVGGATEANVGDYVDSEHRREKSEEQAIIRLRAEKERVAREVRHQELMQRVENLHETSERAVEARVVVGEILEIPESQISTTDTFADLTLKVTREVFAEKVARNTTKATQYMNAASDITEHAVGSSSTKEDLRNTLNDPNSKAQQKAEALNGLKKVEKIEPQEPLTDSVIAGIGQEIIKQKNPGCHKKCCTEYNNLNEANKILFDIGFAKQHRRLPTEADIKELTSDESARECDILGYIQEGERTIGIIYKSNIDVSQIHKTGEFTPEILALGPDKLQELISKPKSTIIQTELTKQEPTITTPHNPPKPESQTPDSDIAAEFPMATIIDPNGPQVQNITALNGNIFRSATIVRNPDGSFTVSSQETNTTNNDTEIKTSKVPAGLGDSKALAEVAKQWVATGAKTESETPAKQDSTTQPAGKAANEAAKPLTDNKVSTPTPAAEGTKTPPAAPKPAVEKPVEVASAR